VAELAEGRLRHGYATTIQGPGATVAKGFRTKQDALCREAGTSVRYGQEANAIYVRARQQRADVRHAREFEDDAYRSLCALRGQDTRRDAIAHQRGEDADSSRGNDLGPAAQARAAPPFLLSTRLERRTSRSVQASSGFGFRGPLKSHRRKVVIQPQ
jgi:hypothetical protein